jgi:FixJ family two-component response regulator
MPTMTGVEVATELLRLRPGLPLIIATGFNANWTVDAVRALGVHDLVAKPLSAASLAQTIHRALHRSLT